MITRDDLVAWIDKALGDSALPGTNLERWGLLFALARLPDAGDAPDISVVGAAHVSGPGGLVMVAAAHALAMLDEDGPDMLHGILFVLSGELTLERAAQLVQTGMGERLIAEMHVAGQGQE